MAHSEAVHGYLREVRGGTESARSASISPPAQTATPVSTVISGYALKPQIL
jgi:hypothetical protein